MAVRSRKLSAAARDVDVRTCADPQRRESCRLNFRLFCETYFKTVFPLAWSDDHLKALWKIERAVLQGALFALAMPRGSGKTSMVFVAAIWANVYGHQQFTCIIGATEPKAEGILLNIKKSLQFNDLLASDFPEICDPIRALEDDARRSAGQTVEGEKTGIVWRVDKVVFPKVKDSKASGSVITVCGITGSVRGQNHTLPDGTVIRPSLVLVDDPQDRESANSDAQCEQRVSILNGDVLGMAGPGKRIAGLMPCTVIRAGDMADRMLDRKLHPDWQGERCKMVYDWPTDAKLWEEYARRRFTSLQNDGDGSEATAFYVANRAAMDTGSRIAWAARFEPGDVSAIQHAWNLRLRDEGAFFAEYQNDPKTDQSDSIVLRADQIIHKLNHWPKSRMPSTCTRVTSFVDVHDAILYWMVCGWEQDFTGYTLDYGTWPEQNRRYFQMRDAQSTLQKSLPGTDKEAFITHGLRGVTSYLFGRVWTCENGTILPLDRLLIDTGYAGKTVLDFIRMAGKGSAIIGSLGVGITASGKPIAEYQKRDGEIHGDNWYMPLANGREQRRVKFDTNHWKTQLHSRLALPAGARGAITLYGDEPHEHRLLADHYSAEYATATEGRGRKVHEWDIRPNKPDNHLFDCGVGCCVAASTCGVGLDRPAARRPVMAVGGARRVRARYLNEQ